MAISVRQDGNKAALDAVLDLIDSGTPGDDRGDFEVLTGALASLAVMTFTAPGSGGAFGAATNGSGTSATATSNTITQSGTPTPGTIGAGRFRDRANSAVVSFTISAAGGGGDMIVTDPVIPANATAVSCSGVTMTLNITN